MQNVTKVSPTLVQCMVPACETQINRLCVDTDEGWKLKNKMGGVYNVILKKISDKTYTFEVTNQDHEQLIDLDKSMLPMFLLKESKVRLSTIKWAANEILAAKNTDDLKRSIKVFFETLDQPLKEWFVHFYKENQDNIGRMEDRHVLDALAIPPRFH